MLEIGQTAPDFTLPQDDGPDVTLSELRGQNVVLFFYPRDDTSGCTKESTAFSGLLDDFKAENTQVLGVSKDTVEKHAKFRTKHSLTVPLLSDSDTSLCEDYGVWAEKKMYGKTFMGIERSTFLIDADGVLRQIWRKVKVAGHAETVLEAVKEL